MIKEAGVDVEDGEEREQLLEVGSVALLVFLSVVSGNVGFLLSNVRGVVDVFLVLLLII